MDRSEQELTIDSLMRKIEVLNSKIEWLYWVGRTPEIGGNWENQPWYNKADERIPDYYIGSDERGD